MITKGRLVVSRNGEMDVMVLRAETAVGSPALTAEIAATLQEVTKLKGAVELVPPGTLPNDGKVIADERPVG
jgi:phenylacetate-CoA ligase